MSPFIVNLVFEPKPSLDDWMRMNLVFHQYFRNRCRNNRMDRILEEIRLGITRYHYISLMVGAVDAYIEDHRRIIEAIRKRKAGEANAHGAIYPSGQGRAHGMLFARAGFLMSNL